MYFRQVDNNILTLLRSRYEHCGLYWGDVDQAEKCWEIKRQYKEAEANWFTKCKSFPFSCIQF